MNWPSPKNPCSVARLKGGLGDVEHRLGRAHPCRHLVDTVHEEYGRGSDEVPPEMPTPPEGGAADGVRVDETRTTRGYRVRRLVPLPANAPQIGEHVVLEPKSELPDCSRRKGGGRQEHPGARRASTGGCYTAVDGEGIVEISPPWGPPYSSPPSS